jgi:LPXTG-site transpeptidase (sortase) family protein
MPTFTVPDQEKRIRRINYSLIFLIVAVNLYIFTAPYVAQFYIWTDGFTGTQEHLQRALDEPQLFTSVNASTKQANRVIIPAMLTDGAIHEGTDARDALNKGIWRWPTSSTPDKGGNTVLLGTRFSYVKPKSEFYFMNRLQRGTKFGITWNGKVYHYKVTTIAKVEGNDTSVLTQTAEPTVTLYTTAPLTYATNRLVVTAQLEKAKP